MFAAFAGIRRPASTAAALLETILTDYASVTVSPCSGIFVVQPSFGLDRRLQRFHRDGSPWTMNVVRGGRVNPPSQRRISFESACADIDSIELDRARGRERSRRGS